MAHTWPSNDRTNSNMFSCDFPMIFLCISMDHPWIAWIVPGHLCMDTQELSMDMHGMPMEIHGASMDIS